MALLLLYFLFSFIILFYRCAHEGRLRLNIKKNKFFCSVFDLHYLCRR